MKLLLIDPNESSVRVYQDVFESWGFEVIPASHENELQTVLEVNKSFDIIVTEIDLLGIKRGKLISALKEKFPDSPIIVLTDHHSVSSAVQAIKNGASEFILKPFDTEKLKELISRILAQKQLDCVDIIS